MSDKPSALRPSPAPARIAYESVTRDMWIKESHRDRYEVIHWESLYDLSGFERRKLARLRCYLENKTLRLKQAFQLGRMWHA
jgi:hypothetical protein